MGITRLRGNLQVLNDTVGSANISDHSITAEDIALGSLDGSLFIDGSIPAEKFDLTSFPGPGLELDAGQFAVNVDDVDLEIVADVLKTTVLVTKQGNAFNNPGQLVQLDLLGKLPVNALSTPDLIDVTGALNSADGLVLLDGLGRLPAIDGSQLTGLVPVPVFADMVEPSGAIDGINLVFVLPSTPAVGSLHLYRNGILQRSGLSNDYTISVDTITFNTAPTSGSSLAASYRI